MHVAVVPVFFKMVSNTIAIIMGGAGVSQIIVPYVEGQGRFANALHVASTSLSAPSAYSIINTAPAAPAAPTLSAAARAPAAQPARNLRRPEAAAEAESAEPAPAAADKPARIVVPVFFKMVFSTVVGITVAAAIAQVIMAIAWPHPTANEQSVFDAMGSTWKGGFAAIFGLVGGKVL
jgi:hypothetical protein